MKSVVSFLLIVFILFVNGQHELCYGLANGTKLKHTNDKYYVCENNKALEFVCGIENFNPILGECIHTEIRSTSEIPDENEITTESAPNRSICTGIENGNLLNNPEFCEGFFLCLFEIAIPAICPDSQYFSTELGKCDNAANVICDDGITTTMRPNKCENYSDGVLFDNPESCSHFFICINNIAISAECPFGLFFNIETGTCNPPEIVDCTPTTTTITEQPTTTTEKPFNDICVGEENGVFMDNPDGCNAFYYCLYENAFPGTCPPPALFNPILQICDSSENVYCPVYETTTEPINVCYSKPDFTFINDPRTCAGYFLCFNEQPSSRTCPEGMYFDPLISICSPSNIVVCGDEWEITTTTQYTTEKTTTTTNSIIPDSCPSTGSTISIPDPLRCSRFTLCISGLEFPMACQQDYHFNFHHQGCLPRDIASCTIPLPVCDPETSSSAPIVLIHPEYCSKFFFCFIGQKQLFECNGGLHFDVATEQCLPRDVVGCELP